MKTSRRSRRREKKQLPNTCPSVAQRSPLLHQRKNGIASEFFPAKTVLDFDLSPDWIASIKSVYVKM